LAGSLPSPLSFILTFDFPEIRTGWIFVAGKIFGAGSGI
jgi:hypothetical protein